MRTLRDTTRRDARIDLNSILAYVVRQVFASDRSYFMIIKCESHVRMGEGEDNRQWAEAIGVANARTTEL